MDTPVLTGIALTIVATGATLGWLAWESSRMRVAPRPEADEIQEATILVRDGYHPDTIRLRAGRPVRLVFQRAEDDPCSARVYLAEPPLNRYLPPFSATAIVFTPERVGSHLFTCEEGRFRGRLIVEPPDPARRGGRMAAKIHGWSLGAFGLRDAAVHAQQGREAGDHEIHLQPNGDWSRGATPPSGRRSCMEHDKKALNGTIVRDEPAQPRKPHDYASGPAMHTVDDPAGEGHMWSGRRPSAEEAGASESDRTGGSPPAPAAAPRGPGESAARAEPGIVIVTGSNGRIGDAVMRRFAGGFPVVVGFDRKAASPPPPGCVYVPVEITSDDSVREGLTAIREHHGAHVAAVVHLAAYYDFFGRPSPLYEEITVRGTGRLLRGLREVGFTVEQFAFSSTMLVHKPAEPGQFITEEWPIEATWAYPASKVETERLIRAERGEIPAVLWRISGVYDDLCHSIPLANQIQRIYERDFTSRLYSGSTAHGSALLHMDDLVDAIERTVERRAELPPEAPILLGEPEVLSYDELQHTIARLIHGEGWETIEIPGQLAPAAKAGAWVLDHVPGQEAFIKPWMIDRANDHYALDITRARTLLGWEPKRSLRETLPKMIATLKADPLGWYRENDLEPPSWLRERAGQGAKAAP